jgi:hypothetical protein
MKACLSRTAASEDDYGFGGLGLDADEKPLQTQIWRFSGNKCKLDRGDETKQQLEIVSNVYHVGVR